MAVIVYILSLLVIGITALYLSFKKSYRLWQTLNVPYVEPTFPFGNFKQLLKKRHLALMTQDLYEELKGKREYAGIYLFKRPVLLVTSPDFAKDVLVRDFSSFTDRGAYYNRKDDPLSANLVFLEGNEWKTLRQKLSPGFTAIKVKTMLHTITTVADELSEYIEAQGPNGSEIDIKNLMARFTTDVISSGVFGLDGNSIKSPDSEFVRIGQKVFNLGKVKSLIAFFALAFPEQARQLGFCMFDRESNEFFTKMVHETIGHRRENNIHRNDLMQIMIEHLRLVQDADDKDEGLTIDEVAANSFIFYFAGFETTSTTLTVALYHLAFNQTIQDQARAEIKRILDKNNGEITHEGLAEMQLTERIIFETLRIFPPAGNVHRVSTKPYTLPNGAVVPQGTFMIVPVFGIHHDEEIYPEPDKFDPERFTEENKSKRHPFAFIPFGEGPRMCIGQRFAMLQMKVGLVKLLNKFRIRICDRTKPNIELDQISFTVIPDGCVWLKLEKI